MEKINEFLMDHWIIILSINILAIFFIIGFLIEKHESKKQKKNSNENKDEKIIWEKVSTNDEFNNKIIDNGHKILKNDVENIEIEDKKELIKRSNNTQKINNNEVKGDNHKIKLNDQESQTLKEITEENRQTLKELDEETRKQLKDNIERIVNGSESIFLEFDKLIPEKKIIDDELKEELENFDVDIEPIKENKKNTDINTDIDLPEIELSVEEEDIWD